MIAQAAVDAVDAWWIIGSAAVVLHGGSVPHVKDVDLMMSAPDAERFLRRSGGAFRKSESGDLFRSKVFGVWSEPPIAVEVFGGFSFATRGQWRALSLATREPVKIKGATVYVPAADELVRVLHSFGRPKDIDRARLLRS